ncbi:hypothetical protein [Paenibacillus physcomitrellae]|uniref:Phage tail protein n=1 Tax=Paenibacillus physcomitrellae TaxID=1619311 RepID=A0ABQ1GS37_9BACL|nr:hypothetical protein [Paenibacillus physcomitrellae]GGA49284.1 hypothetical protein GCM10010917_38190 [Paenibacillus physcomitrellae]
MENNSVNLLSGLSKQGEKLVKILSNGEGSHISIIAMSDTKLQANVSGKSVQPYAAFIGSKLGGKKSYSAYLDNEVKSLNLKENGFIRIIIDANDNQELKYHYYLNGESEIFNNSVPASDDVIVLFIETLDFTQFCIFDGSLKYKKTAEVFATKQATKESIRVIAFALIKNIFPELKLDAWFSEEEDRDE